MLKLTPILLAILYGVVAWHFSSWRLKKELDEKSTELADPRIAALTKRMAQALDLPRIRVHVYEIEPVNGMAVPDVLSRILPGVGGWIAGLLTSLLAARLSRSDEYEADAYAAALLTKSGIGVAPQIRLFEKLGALTASSHGRAPAWLLSHPKPEERIAAIRQLSDGWNA